jgi:signal transduction histidine kinase
MKTGKGRSSGTSGTKASRTKPSGTGVGLTVARRLVEAQGGRLEVASQPTGTTFRISLPVRRASAAGATPAI